MSVILNRELRKFVAPEFITGDDARFFAGRYASNFHSRKVLLVSDHSVLKTAWMDDIKESLADSGIEYEIFADVSQNPRDSDVMLGSDLYMAGEFTGIVAVGGGSVLDCAKGIGIVSANGGHIMDYVGVDLVKNPMPPLICIPTTGGSSADVSQYAVISSRERCCKNLIISKSLVPDVSLLDTVPLMTQPDHVTLYSGIDALTHAMEAYVSNGSSHFSDLMAIESVRQVGEAFPYEPGLARDPDFRFKTLLSSLYAGIAFSNAGLGLMHSLSHSIGGMYDIPHGLAGSVVIEAVIRYNFLSAPEKYRKIAGALFVETQGKSDAEVLTLLLEKIDYIKGPLSEKRSIRSFGASEEDIPVLVKNTLNDPCVATNPRMPRAGEIEDIYMQILQ